uniref:PML C-terminal domain-containing protein n=1 Tax=Magallana gigas TaxID=29159 RepID=A0A8W8MJ85_MAGGI
MVEKKAMSVATSRKIAGSGLGFRHIMLAHKRDELSGVKTLLGEHGLVVVLGARVVERLATVVEGAENRRVRPNTCSS